MIAGDDVFFTKEIETCLFGREKIIFAQHTRATVVSNAPMEHCLIVRVEVVPKISFKIIVAENDVQKCF